MLFKMALLHIHCMLKPVSNFLYLSLLLIFTWPRQPRTNQLRLHWCLSPGLWFHHQHAVVPKKISPDNVPNIFEARFESPFGNDGGIGNVFRLEIKALASF